MQPDYNNLGYMIDPKLRNVNRLLTLSFKNGAIDPMTHYFSKYYIPLDFNALVDKKPFFDHSVKYKHKAHEKLMEISRNDA